MSPTRTYQIAGGGEIKRAILSGVQVRLLLVSAEARSPETREARALAEQRGIEVREATPRVVERLANGDASAELLALVGRDPHAGVEGVVAAGGASWLLVGVAYPGNVGMVVRTAEVSGAQGILIDAKFDHEGRKAALRASMRADKFMPVLWGGAEQLLDPAREAAHRLIAIDERGTHAPWQIDLCGPSVFIVGGENGGIPERILSRCDEVVRIPMAGFIPCYNLQAAVSAVASERLRQLGD